jgi:hypothetical protein
MHYETCISHQMQKHKFSVTCPDSLFVESIVVPHNVVPWLGSSVGGYVPYVLYGFYADDLMKYHGSVGVVRLGCGVCTTLSSGVSLTQRLNYWDWLVGVAHEFIELAIGLRLCTEVLIQDLSRAWVTVQG